MGLGYTWVLTGISAVREILGSGTLFNIPVLPDSYEPVLFFILPPGGFFVFALFISLNNFFKSRIRGAGAASEPEAEGSHGCGGMRA
jgi:electron transport complex protein RnfE